jgi:hypothetical protein
MANDPNSPVVVTLRDVYQEVRKLADTVGLISGQGDKLVDHESRIRSLERWRFLLSGALVASIGGQTAQLILSLH